MMELFCFLAIVYCIWFYCFASSEQREGIRGWSNKKALGTAKGGFWLFSWLNKRL